MTLSLVSFEGNYLVRDGKRFMAIGAHWVPAQTGLHWALEWNPADIDADFKKMKEMGFNTVRFDLFWAWFEPHPGIYNPEAFNQLDYLIKLAYKYEIYLHPTFFIGGEVGEAFWDVPWRQGRNPHKDAEMLRLQTDHVTKFAKRYKGEPAIMAWDLTDEPPFWIVGDDTTDAMAINWTRLLSGALRRYDPEHILCVGTSMEDISRSPFRPDNLTEEVNFFSVHPYSIYMLDRFPDPMLSERGTYAAAFQTQLSSGAGRPTMIHEFGASSAQYHPDRIAKFDRVLYYSGLGAGTCGFLPWCFTDAAPELWKQTPYLRAPHETQFGITTWDRKNRPRGDVFVNFAKLLAQMKFDDLEPALGDAAIIIPHEWAKPHGDMSRLGINPNTGAMPYNSTQDHFDSNDENIMTTRAMLNSFILARRAGLKADLPREYTTWQDRRMLLLPAPLTGTESNITHVHTIFWDEVRKFVYDGGLTYVSVCSDISIPEMDDLFGARLTDHAAVSDVTLTVTQDWGGLKKGDRFEYQADPGDTHHWCATVEVGDGQVIAIDQDGRPALISHDYGKGKILLCTYPLELYLAVKPSAFDSEEPTHRIYAALAKAGKFQPLASTDHPSVEATVLEGKKHGYIVLTNHQAKDANVKLTTNIQYKKIYQLTPKGKQMREVAPSDMVEVPAYNGVILEWEG